LCAAAFLSGGSATGAPSSGLPATGEGFASGALGATAGADAAAGAALAGAAAGTAFAEAAAGAAFVGAAAQRAESLGTETVDDRHAADPGPTSTLRRSAAPSPMANPTTFRRRPGGMGVSRIVGCRSRIAMGPVVFRMVM
jgi:hypothetical protein